MRIGKFSFLLLALIAFSNTYGQLNSTDINDHSPPGCYDLPPFNQSHNYPTCKGGWVKLSNIDISNFPCTGKVAIKVLEDDFNGDELDHSTWRIGYPWGAVINGGSHSFGGMPYSNGNLNVVNGYLYMVPKKQFVAQGSLGLDYDHNPVPHKDFDYTEPALSTWNRWGYGKFEVRCKMADNPVDLNAAFWLMGDCDNEIDIFETFDDINQGGIYDNDPSKEHVNMRIKTSVYSSIGHCGENNRFSREYHTKIPYGQTLNQWHTYTVHWDEYSIQLEIDGVNSNKFVTSMFKLYPQSTKRLCGELEDGKDYRKFSTYPYETDYLMNLILDEAVRGDGISQGDVGDLYADRMMIVDYVKVWQSFECGQTKNLCGAYDDKTMRGTEFGYQVNISPNNCGWLLYGNSGGRSHFNAIAENEVALLPGTDIESVTGFSAFIQPCAYTQRQSTTPIYDSIMEPEYDEYHINTIDILPNPNSGSFTLSLPNYEQGSLKVYNSLGELIHQQSVSGDNQKIFVNLENAKAGFYFVVIETKTNTYNSKFIIN